MQSAPTSAQEDTARPDIEANAQSVGRHLRGGNKAPAAIHSYLDAVTRLDAFLTTRGMPRSVGSLHREHVEAYAEDQLSRLKPASAANRRSLQQFFRWLVDEGEIHESPMAWMKPPHHDHERSRSSSRAREVGCTARANRSGCARAIGGPPPSSAVLPQPGSSSSLFLSRRRAEHPDVNA